MDPNEALKQWREARDQGDEYLARGDVEVKLSATDKGPGRRRGNTGQYGSKTEGDDYALTWDEWGNVLAALFALDPDAVAGRYDGVRDFHWQTGYRFKDGPVEHHHHKWEWDGSITMDGQRVTRQKCKGCPAVKHQFAGAGRAVISITERNAS